jgi:hypothetical protein
MNQQIEFESAFGQHLAKPLTVFKLKPKQISKYDMKMLIPSFKQTDASARIEFTNIFCIFTQKHSKKLHSRQEDIIKKLIAIYSDGVVLSKIILAVIRHSFIYRTTLPRQKCHSGQ